MDDYSHALRVCRQFLKSSNTTSDDSPLLFRACMCANHWQPSCDGIVDDDEAVTPHQRVTSMAHSSVTHTPVIRGETLGSSSSGLPRGPLVPLCTVMVIVIVGIVGMVYAYRNRKRLEQQAEVRDRRRMVRLQVLHCSTSPTPTSGSSSETSSIADPPPPYSVTAQPYSVTATLSPPPYQAVCSTNEEQSSGVSANDRPPDCDVILTLRPSTARVNTTSLPTIDENGIEE